MLIAVGVLLVTALGLAHAFTAAGLATKASARDVAARTALERVLGELDAVPFSQLLSWNGALRDFGDHSVVVVTTAATPRLVVVECIASDDGSRAELARVATCRTAES